MTEKDLPCEEEEVDKYWERMLASQKEERKKADAAAIKDATSKWVRIQGLQSTSGQALNGRVGQLLKKELNEDGRYAVEVDGVKGGKLLKKSNLVDVQPEDLVQTYLLPDHKVQLYPKYHSMFTECNPNGNAPALALCDCPLVVKMVGERSGDNQWATWMMIDPVSGFAPPMWQTNVGQTLVYRPGGKDLGRDDMCSINEFLGDLLDHYGEKDFDPRSWLNPEWFCRYIRSSGSYSIGSVEVKREFNIINNDS